MATYNSKKKPNNTSSSNKPLTSAQALKNYNNVQSRKPASFTYNDKQLKKLYNDAMNRKDFSFDLNGNAFYNQYKDKFTKQGQLAMTDTVGQVAAASGGYGNSYAQTAGQQVYQNNLDQLSDIVPDLYNLAFQQYQYEGQQLQDKYAMATGERDFAYGKYRDDVGDWQYNNDTAYNIYADTRDYEYRQSRDKVADDQWAQEFGYQKERDKIADSQWQKTYDRGVYESDRDFNYQQSRDKVADSQWQKTYDRGIYESDRNFNYQQSRDKVADSQWQKTFDRGVYESDRDYNRGVYESDRNFNEDQRQFNLNYNLDVDKFGETKKQNAIQNQQWQQSFDRSVYESDRDYNRGVYESDRNYNRDVFESDRAYDYQVGRDKVTDSWNDRNYSLSQQELAETIRHNKANEGYNMQSLGIDNENPFDEDTGNEDDTVDLGDVKPTASYDKLSSRAKEIISLSTHKPQDARIKMTYAALEKEQITPEEAVYLFKSCGYTGYLEG